MLLTHVIIMTEVDLVGKSLNEANWYLIFLFFLNSFSGIDYDHVYKITKMPWYNLAIIAIF